MDVTPDPAEEVVNTTVSALLCRRCGQFDCTSHPHTNAAPAEGAPADPSHRPPTGGCTCGAAWAGARPSAASAGPATAAATDASAWTNTAVAALSRGGQLFRAPLAGAAVAPSDGIGRDDRSWSAADSAALRLFYADAGGDPCALATILSVRPGPPLTCTAVRAAVVRLSLAPPPRMAPAAPAAGSDQPAAGVAGLPPPAPVPPPPPSSPGGPFAGVGGARPRSPPPAARLPRLRAPACRPRASRGTRAPTRGRAYPPRSARA